MVEKFIGIRTNRDAVKMAIRFLRCSFLNNPELSVMNTEYEGNEDRIGFLFGSDFFAEIYNGENVPSEEALYESVKKNNFLFQGVASFDPLDMDRVVLTVIPSDKDHVALICNQPFGITGNEGSSNIDALVKYLCEI